MRAVPVLSALLAGSLALPVGSVLASGRDCAAEAAAFADRFIGDRETVTRLLEGGITGAVTGGAWLGSPDGAERGARAGAAKAYAGTMAQDPRVWQGLYDSAYQTCAAQQPAGDPSTVSVDRPAPATQGCRSRAGVAGSHGGGGTVSAGSLATGCR